MKLSIAISSLAVSLGVVQGRVLLNGNIEVMGGREAIDVDGPMVHLEPRGIAFSKSSTDCTESTTLPSSASTNQGIATVPSSTETKTFPIPLNPSSSQDIATSTTSYSHYIYPFPAATSTGHGPATFPSSSEDYSKTDATPSSRSSGQGTATLSSSTESCSETSTSGLSSFTAQDIATRSSSTKSSIETSPLPPASSTAQNFLPSSTESCSETSTLVSYTNSTGFPTLPTPGSKPPVSSPESANTLSLSITAAGPSMYASIQTAATAASTETQVNGTATVEGSTYAGPTPQLPWMGSGQSAPPMGSVMPLVITPLPGATSSGSQSVFMGGGVEYKVALLASLLALAFRI